MQKVGANSFHLHKAKIMSAAVTLPDSFQVVVVGTGLVESIVAAAAARNGQTVLHIDTAGYYGGDFASFSLEGLNRWIGDQQHDGEQAQPAASSEETLPELGDGEEYLDLGHFKTVDNIQETWDIDNQEEEDDPAKKDAGDNMDATDKDLSEHSEAAAEESPEESRQEESKPEKKWSKDELLKESRRFNIDLTPRLLYARGSMVELLISSNISRYTEFKSVTRVLTQIEGRLEHVPSSRADVFGTKHISVVEKRILMKFLSAVNQKEDIAAESENKSFRDFLKQEKLTENLIHFVVHSIAMVKPEDSASLGLQQTKKFLSSLGRFGSTPFLWSMYGSGELPQAFCRLCAVFGGVYYLGRSLSKLIVKEGRCVGLVTEGKRINCEQLILSDTFTPDSILPSTAEQARTQRCIYITDKSLLPTEKEQITLLSLPSQNLLHVIEVGPGTAACPRGLQVVHGSCVDDDTDIDASIRSVLPDKSVLYSASFIQISRTGNALTSLENVYRAGGPMPELDFDTAVQQGSEIYTAMFPDQPFLPRAPDPEEIIIGEEEEKEPDTVNEDQKTEEASEPEPAEHEERSDLVGDHEDVAEDNENARTNSAGSDEEKPE